MSEPTGTRTQKMVGDYYPTPVWATRALMEMETFHGSVWEPACGGGDMAEVIGMYNLTYASDLYDRGYGDTGVDFLKEKRVMDNIITNPPYTHAEEFILQAKRLAKRKFAFLLRLSFLEGSRRHHFIYDRFPPYRILVFSERIAFNLKEGKQYEMGSSISYAWFIWRQQFHGKPELDWIAPGERF